MMNIAEIYKKKGISGVAEAINEIYDHYEDIEEENPEGFPQWIDELNEFIYDHELEFSYYPQTILDALFRSSLLEYPEINAWFEELKRECKREPVKPLWASSEPLRPLLEVKAHGDLIQGLVYIGQNRFVTSSEDGILKVWMYEEQDDGRIDLSLIYKIKGHNGEPINYVTYHSDKKWVASCGDDYVVRLWDAETFEMIGELRGHTDYVSRAVFSDHLLFSSSKDGRIGVWDLNTLQNKTFLEGHKGWATTMSLSPDKKRLFSVSKNNQLIEWDVENFTLKHEISQEGKNHDLDVPEEHLSINPYYEEAIGHLYRPTYAKWESDNKLYSAYQEVIEWDTETWKILRSFGYNYNSIMHFIIYESFLVTFSTSIRILDLHTGEVIKECLCPGERKIRLAFLSEDKKLVICCDEKGYITFWDWEALIKGNYSIGQPGIIYFLQVFNKEGEEDSAVALTGGYVPEALIWDLDTGKIIDRIKRPKGAKTSYIKTLKVDGQSDQALIMCQKYVCRQSIFNLADREEIELPNEVFYEKTAVSTKNGFILGELFERPLYWNLSKKSVEVFDNKYGCGDKSFISPDQKYVLITTLPEGLHKKEERDNRPWKTIFSPLVLIDREKEKKIGTFWSTRLFSWVKYHKKWKDKNHKLFYLRYSDAACWSPDGKYFAAGFSNSKIYIWSAKTKLKKRSIKVSEDKIYIAHMTWQENGFIAAMIGDRNVILQIDPKKGKVLKTADIYGAEIKIRGEYQKGRYWLWVSDEKIVGIFDTLKFEVVFTTLMEVYPRSAIIEKDKLLIGGDDGFIYGYDIKGLLS